MQGQATSCKARGGRASQSAQLGNRNSRRKDWMGPPRVVVILLLGIDTEEPVDRREHILRRLGIDQRERTLGIGGSHHATALNRSARQSRTEDIGIMVSSGVVVDPRRAAELA